MAERRNWYDRFFPDSEVLAGQAALSTKLDLVLAQQAKIMCAISDLKPILDGIATDVTAVAAGVTSIQTKLAALQNSTTSTLSPADQATLDAANSEAAGIKTSLDTVAASLTSASASTAKPA
jgi:hypothetical protein